MSKKRTRRGNTSPSPKHRYAKRAPVHRIDPVTFKPNLGLALLQEIEDRRRWRPEPIHARPVVTIRVGQAARLTIKQPAKYNAPAQTKARIAFQEPNRLPVCIRRKERREVIHATGQAGRKGQKPPRKNQWSEIQC